MGLGGLGMMEMIIQQKCYYVIKMQLEMEDLCSNYGKLVRKHFIIYM